MLTPAKVTLLMLVGVGGLVTAYVAKGMMAKETPVVEIERKNVPMAIADLAPGTEITAAHLGQGPVYVKDLKPDMLLNDRVLIGRVVREPISAANPIRSNQLYPPNVRPELDIAAGKVAVAVAIGDRADMVDGFVKPGKFVNVHMTPSGLASDERAGRGLTLTLFRGIKILAVNNGRDANRMGNSVTLEMTEEQSNIMILARDRGDITLTYSPDGPRSGVVSSSREDRATLEEILGLKPVKKIQTEIYHGTTRGVHEFRNGQKYNDIVVPRGRTANQPAEEIEEPATT